jgi:predicted transcriptional regulator
LGNTPPPPPPRDSRGVATDTDIDLRGWRNELDLTQADIARMARVAPSTVRLFDGGYRPKGHSPAMDRIVGVLESVEAEREVP